MAGVGGGYRVERQGTDGGGVHPMIGMAFAKCLDIHAGGPCVRAPGCLLFRVEAFNTTLAGNFKHSRQAFDR